MNIDNNLILIKGEDKTASVTSWRFDHYKPVVFITFNGQKEYPYSKASRGLGEKLHRRAERNLRKVPRLLE